MSRKQKQHDLIDDFRPIIQKHKEEDNYLSRLDMCMIISKELGISLKVLCNLIPNELSSKFCKGFKRYQDFNEEIKLIRPTHLVCNLAR